MKLQTIDLNGTEYVVIPREQYDTLISKRPQRSKPKISISSKEDAGDLAEANRRMKSGKPKSYAQLRRSLGLK